VVSAADDSVLLIDSTAAEKRQLTNFHCTSARSVLMAAYRVFSLAFFSSLTVALNRTVLPSHRGTMNGLTTLGGSVAKALGPMFAGALVAFSFSSGVFAPHVGAVFMFFLIGGLGVLVSMLSFVLIHGDEEDESNFELKV
jgi:MFS family permease